MSKGTAIIGMLVALVVGVFIGNTWHGSSDGPSVQVPAAALPDSNVERFKIPVGNAPTKGPEHAKVTIIEWSDFQCPFCSRVEPTVDQIMKTYGKDVRVAWKDQPLPFHQNAMPAAQISRAAYAKKGAAGFWKMHDTLFHNQQALDRPALEKYAKDMGLSDGDIKEALDDKKYDAAIQADSQEGTKFGARGTPSFFINGRALSGAQPFDAFKKIIDEEIANANRAINGGAKLASVYDALTANGKPAASAAPDRPAQPTPAQADPQAVYKVPLGHSPEKGSKTAKVTIVEFSDFQCPFCSRVEPTVDALMKDYGKDLRVVWKNNPLPFHQNAMPAAKAAMAAGQQGKFWEMHDKLFADQQHLDEATYEKYANELGLNVGKFKAAMADVKLDADIKEDSAVAAKFGAQGTPGFFINGRPLRGAQPKESFKAVIDKEIEAANAALKRGVKPADLYAELTKDGKDKAEGAAAPAKQQPSPGEPDQNVVYKAIVGDAPVKGADAKHAKVTIVEFSDFQCPFCGRVEPTVDQVMKDYGQQVRVAFKQLPLPFHQNAHVAAEAALAAKAQGKFWEMHGVMFKNQQALDRPSLEKYAQQVGLNVDKFKADLDSGKYKQKVDAELAEGNKIGARGTPSFFINGKPFVGAQPYEAFKGKIDEAIKEADAKAHGGNFAKYYDDLMKTAKAEVAAAPANAGGPPEDKTVYKVDAGNAPAVGPKTAPVQIVEFSDFQCPFCSRVVPTIKQIEDKYPGKVHLAFRNYPLPFHNNAQGAAEAGAAANAQGKFWAMHDKMFANQGALDRPSLEKYAQEIGLDVSKFKSDLDAGKYKDEVQKDVQYANGLGGGGFGTPTFFINGRKIAGAMPFESFAQIIDEELKKKHK
ncbi:MAG: Periplasmic thiol:disulfide interchange protein DsbA [Myxococcales bacterium]|nr:Periplasmic thiol:disulfide interchange protein DsbA [Myxococcales bacterium]